MSDGLTRGVKTVVVIPAGRCPVQLEGTDEAAVKKWIGEVTKTLPPNVDFAPKAYKYWARHTYDTNSHEYREAVNVISSLLDDSVSRRRRH